MDGGRGYTCSSSRPSVASDSSRAVAVLDISRVAPSPHQHSAERSATVQRCLKHDFDSV